MPDVKPHQIRVSQSIDYFDLAHPVKNSMEEKRQNTQSSKNTLSWDQIQLADMKHAVSDPVSEKFHPYLQPMKKS